MTGPGSVAKSPTAVHLTVVHSADDPRILAKECRTLAAAGYGVHMLAPGAEAGDVDGVRVHGLGAPARNRLVRMTRAVLDVFLAARRLDADLYHFHDPELLPVGLALRAFGKPVIYDVHEDLPRQILTKSWIPALLRRPIAWTADLVERLAARWVSAVVTAEPYVRERFEGRARALVTVNNYPRLEEFPSPDGDWSARERAVGYAGSITALRGAHEMVEAVSRTDALLLLAGRFSPPGLEQEVSNHPGFGQVEFLGQVSRAQLAGMLARVRAGLVVLKPVPNYVEAMPTKMLEYMSAGIPVIASNFPAWAAIVERHQCGMCVDPTSPAAIAEAIAWVLDHPEEARAMGARGRAAVERHYTWDAERPALVGLYERLVGPPVTG